METFGQLARRLRHEQGLTLAQVTAALESYLPEGETVSVAMLSRIETDERIPSPKLADAMISFYRIDSEEAMELLAESHVSRRWQASSAVKPVGRRLAGDHPDAAKMVPRASEREALRAAARAAHVQVNHHLVERAASPRQSAVGAMSHDSLLAAPPSSVNELMTVAEIAVRQLERAAFMEPVSREEWSTLQRRARELSLVLDRVFSS